MRLGSGAINDPRIIEIWATLKEAEVSECKTKSHGCGTTPVPHFRPEYVKDGVLYLSGNCGSNGRRFDVASEQFVGYSHCTCDYCF